MKLSARLTVALGFCAVLLFGGAGLVQLEQVERDLGQVETGEALLLGRSLQTAIENAIRDQQPEDIAGILADLSRVNDAVVVFVFDRQGVLLDSTRDLVPDRNVNAAAAEAIRRTNPLMDFGQTQPHVLLLALRLSVGPSAESAALVLQKPLDELERDLTMTRVNILLTTAAFVAVVAGATWLLARRYVSRPLAALVQNMQRVRDGDTQLENVNAASDEVSEALFEFGHLVEDLEQARHRVDQEFEARRHLERALQDADKLITLGQLSAVMAHEIGSPLQVLLGRAHALHRQADDPIATRRTADMLIEQTERISRIVSQLLSTTRRTARARALVNVEKLLDRVTALLEYEAKKRQVTFALRKATHTEVQADGDQIQQVVLNLLRNALEASPERAAIAISLTGDDDYLHLGIQDHGPGLSPQARAHLFEPFFSTKASSGGNGLGLSVVRSIVRDHGGNVDFVETLEPGCLVKVTLPRETAAEVV